MEWLRFSATQPAKIDRSAREQAAWLFFRVRLGLGSWSVADLHVLVVGLQYAKSRSLAVVLAFLYQLIKYKTDSLISDTSNVAISTSFAMLRLIELVALHFA